MLPKFFADLLLIQGKIADNIRENKPSMISNLAVLAAAFIYGTVAFYIRGPEILGELNYSYLIFFIVFGYLYMVISQIGITLVLWASCKIVGSTAGVFVLFSNVGYVFIPYGSFVALFTYYTSAGAELPLIGSILAMAAAVATFLLFAYGLIRVVHLIQDFSIKKAFTCVAISIIFLSSFLYIFGY